ncbi:MAG: ATP-binding protein [Desulfatiglandales bacterium]
MNEDTTILVVDDEKAIREGCHRLLSGKGYHVLTAEDGVKALDVLGQDSVDILLIDLKMPIMGGEETLEIARPRYPAIPIIIMTGHGTVDKAVNCMKKGAYDFITKPFQVDQFLITISRAADKRRLELSAFKFQQENVQNLYDLALEKSRLKTIINCMANGVMVTNRNMEIVLHNPAFKRLLEVADDIDKPTPIRQIIHNERLIRTLDEIQSGKVAENGFVSQEVCLGDKVLRAISAPAMGIDRNVFLRVVGTVTVMEDITIFKRLDQMKTDFVSKVAHELKSPLSSIRQLNHVLFEGLAGPLQEKQQDFVGRGLKKIDALLDLVNDLLNVAKIEEGQAVPRPVPVDLRQLIQETCVLMETKADEQDIRLAYVCEDLEPIEADPKNIAAILNNLISNAINYSPKGGQVNVAARKVGDLVEITVKDRGFGIPSEELPKIFDKFYRVKHPSTRNVPGTGLGLTIVKHVVESHHGRIEVESVQEEGTTFRVILPTGRRVAHSPSN